jgi:hypothetical protein
MLKKVQFSFTLLLFFISSIFLVSGVFGGANDKWRVCCVGCTSPAYSPGDATSVAGTTYYCCCVDSTAAWGTSNCSYPQNVPYCNKAGKSYFADQQNSDCTYSDRGDNICRSSAFASGCTAAPECNGKKPGDSCGTDKICDSNCNCISCKKEGESCSVVAPCCSHYVSGTTCYYSATCSGYCSFLTCSIADSCTANTLVVGKTCLASGCSSGTTYKCDSTTHTNCQSVSCGGTTYYCTYDGSTWQWRTSKPAEVCNDGIDNDCDGKTDSADPDCAIGSIEGTVKDVNTGNPIAGATVSASGPSSGSASTNSNGYYLISNLNSGSYTVTASATGYNSQSKSASVSAGSTTTVNFDLTPFCNNNSICDPGETQACSDCKTFVSIYPTYTYPGQQVTITVYFNDSRFDVDKPTYDVEFDLFISNIPWNSTNGCDIGGKKLRSEMNCGCGTGGCKGKHGYYGSSEYWVDFVDGYAKITATCKIPANIAAGSHTLKAIPVIYSSVTPLNPGEAVFEVAIPLEKILSDLQAKIISFLRRITGLFILR